MHQTVGNSLHAMQTMQPPAGVDEATQLVDVALANCLFATRFTIHGGFQASPGSLAFICNVVLDVPFIVDWNYS